jgi:2'-5' RNA ligase
MFTAISIPNDASQQLSKIRADLKGARWVDSSLFHLTLVFLGDVNVYLYRQIKQQLKAVDFNAFRLTFNGLEVFKNDDGSPNVLYAKVESNPALVALQDEMLRLIGMFHPHLKLAHSFTPHITLARFYKGEMNQIDNFLSYHQEIVNGEFEVNQFNLFSSRSTPVGSIYTKLETYEANTFEADLSYSKYQIL